MNKQRIAILIAAGLGMLATFLPWVKVPFIGSINGTQGDGIGWVTFVLYLIPLIICLVGKQSEAIKGAKLTVAVTTSIYASLYGLKALSESASIEVGPYLVVLAGIGVTNAAYFIKDKTAPNRMVQKSSPPKPNDNIKIKIKRLHRIATVLLVIQGINYLEVFMYTNTPPIQFNTVGSYLGFNLLLIIAILLFIRASFLSSKLKDDNENSDISTVQNLPNVSPAPNPNTSHTNSRIEKISKLKELKELLDAGILNQEEYDNEKAKILS